MTTNNYKTDLLPLFSRSFSPSPLSHPLLLLISCFSSVIWSDLVTSPTYSDIPHSTAFYDQRAVCVYMSMMCVCVLVVVYTGMWAV